MKLKIRNSKSEIRRDHQGQMTKTDLAYFRTSSHSPFVIRHSSLENGMVTVIFIALLAIMMILVMVEASSVIRLHREVKLLEQQQIKRLNAPQTNVVSTATSP
jgi:hypothetical protein